MHLDSVIGMPVGGGPVPAAPEGSPPADETEFTSLLFTLKQVRGVFDDPYRVYRFRIPRSPACLICSTGPLPGGEDLDAALDQALARLGDE